MADAQRMAGGGQLKAMAAMACSWLPSATPLQLHRRSPPSALVAALGQARWHRRPAAGAALPPCARQAGGGAARVPQCHAPAGLCASPWRLD